MKKVYLIKSSFVFLSFFYLFISVLQAKENRLQSVYDVLHYQIELKILPDNQEIIGSNQFKIRALKGFKSISFNLFRQFSISSVIYDKKVLPLSRSNNDCIIIFPETIKKGETLSFTVHYSGKPTVAKNAPWDGGFVWQKDSNQKPWVGLACIMPPLPPPPPPPRTLPPRTLLPSEVTGGAYGLNGSRTPAEGTSEGV